MAFFQSCRVVIHFLLLLCCLFSTITHAKTEALLSPEKAFSFSVESTNNKTAVLSWNIQPDYYLYQHKFTVTQGQKPVALQLPKAVQQYDDNFGHSQVYYHQIHFNIQTKPSQTYHVTWQGCAKDRLCYPLQQIDFQTDADGLVAIQDPAAKQQRFLDLANQTSVTEATSSAGSTSAQASDQSAVAQDQLWSSRLEQHSLGYAIILFLGLGMLLAFTPCSLPMLPILSSLIISGRKGLQAWLIALTFVFSMALVYAVLGLIASAAGLNFQRWLQQPATLIAFSLLFVVFALNLFGLFEIRLPQRLVHRLDQIQSLQRGGTLFGAAIMGVISALLVGPCMTAPLAGTLLFISQTQDQWQGAVLLFCLGFGMGIPLLLASILGAKILPKAGQWMHQIKVIFAFIMLALSLYFIRPLLPMLAIQCLSLVLGLSFIIYVFWRLIKHHDRFRGVYILLLVVIIPWVTYNQYQHIKHYQLEQQQGKNDWHVATTASQFQHILQQAPSDRAVVIDVYADWCVACQPIEHHVLKEPEVQSALQPYYLIKLDLSQYDASHQALLCQWQILGPPTYVFLDSQQKEIRSLRLTGAFSKTELLKRLNTLAAQGK